MHSNSLSKNPLNQATRRYRQVIDKAANRHKKQEQAKAERAARAVARPRIGGRGKSVKGSKDSVFTGAYILKILRIYQLLILITAEIPSPASLPPPTSALDYYLQDYIPFTQPPPFWTPGSLGPDFPYIPSSPEGLRADGGNIATAGHHVDFPIDPALLCE